MNERERNRIRKLGVKEGREWDRDKEQNDNGRGGARTERRNDAYGHREDDDLRMYEWHDDRGRGRGRGRGGGRSGGRGRGRGRGGFDGQADRQPDVGAEAEFPALPVKVGSTTQPEPKPTVKRIDSLGAGGGTWADQVENETGS
jgi:hypothetical protein